MRSSRQRFRTFGLRNEFQPISRTVRSDAATCYRRASGPLSTGRDRADAYYGRRAIAALQNARRRSSSPGHRRECTRAGNLCVAAPTRARIIHVKWVGSGECTCGRPRTLVSLTAALTPTLVLRAGALSTLLTSRGTRALGLIEKRQVAPEIRTPRVLGDGLIGIDFDRCIDENGELHQAVVRSIIALGSYAEFSPSGRGVHILVHGAIGRSRRFAE